MKICEEKYYYQYLSTKEVVKDMGSNIFNIGEVNQLNMAEGDATINATQIINDDVMMAEIRKQIDELLEIAHNNSIVEVAGRLEQVKEDYKKGLPGKEIILEQIKALSAILSVANGIPTLYQGISKLIDNISKLI